MAHVPHPHPHHRLLIIILPSFETLPWGSACSPLPGTPDSALDALCSCKKNYLYDWFVWRDVNFGSCAGAIDFNVWTEGSHGACTLHLMSSLFSLWRVHCVWCAGAGVDHLMERGAA
jgi:hypothetical protein